MDFSRKMSEFRKSGTSTKMIRYAGAVTALVIMAHFCPCVRAGETQRNGADPSQNSTQKKPDMQALTEFNILNDFARISKEGGKRIPPFSENPSQSEIENYLNACIDVYEQSLLPFFRNTDTSGTSQEFRDRFNALNAIMLQELKVSRLLADGFLRGNKDSIQRYSVKKMDLEAEQTFARGQLAACVARKIATITKESERESMKKILDLINKEYPTPKMQNTGDEYNNLKAFGQLGVDYFYFRIKLLGNADIHRCPPEFISHYKEYCRLAYEMVEVIRNRPPLPTSKEEFLLMGLATIANPAGGMNAINSMDDFANKMKRVKNSMDEELSKMKDLSSAY